jgi:hypothetical protein
MEKIMQASRRAFVIGGLTLPLSLTLLGCTTRSLSPIKTTPTLQPTPLNLREARVGQSWKYLKINQFNSEPIELIEDQISAIENGQIIISRKGQKSQNLGNEVQSPYGKLLSDSDWDASQTYQSVVPIYLNLNQINLSDVVRTSYQVGNSSYRLPIAITIRQFGWESITIPSGTFTAIKIEKLIRFQHNEPIRSESFRVDRYWFVPEIGRWVVRETSGTYFIIAGSRRNDMKEDFLRYELQSWSR